MMVMGKTWMNAESRRNGGKGPVLVLHKLGPGLQCTILAKNSTQCNSGDAICNEEEIYFAGFYDLAVNQKYTEVIKF